MKKRLAIIVTLALLLCCVLVGAVAEGGRQTASTVLDRDGESVIVTVDLTGGWSVEFASAALYLYDGEITEGREADAIGLTLEKEVYDEYIAEAENSESRREIENGVCYTSEGTTYYVVAVGSSAYFLLDVPNGADGDAIYARLDLVNEKEYYAAQAEAVAETDAAADEAQMDQYLSGEWLEVETQFTQMTIEKNPERGWDVEIASPLTHGAYVFKTTIRYDSELHCFTYNKGKFWDVPITEEEESELGEAKIAGTIGTFTFSGDDQNLILAWVDDSQPKEEIIFEKAAEDIQDPIAAFEGTWIAGRAMLTIENLDDVIHCTIRWGSSASEETEWTYEAMYDEVTGGLTTFETGIKTNRVYGDGGAVISEEVVFNDGAANFTLNDDDTLTWTDFKETPGENELIFERAQAE